MASHCAGSPDNTQESPPRDELLGLEPALAWFIRLSTRPKNCRPSMLISSKNMMRVSLKEFCKRFKDSSFNSAKCPRRKWWMSRWIVVALKCILKAAQPVGAATRTKLKGRWRDCKCRSISCKAVCTVVVFPVPAVPRSNKRKGLTGKAFGFRICSVRACT